MQRPGRGGKGGRGEMRRGQREGAIGRRARAHPCTGLNPMTKTRKHLTGTARFTCSSVPSVSRAAPQQ